MTTPTMEHLLRAMREVGASGTDPQFMLGDVVAIAQRFAEEDNVMVPLPLSFVQRIARIQAEHSEDVEVLEQLRKRIGAVR